MTEPDGPEPCVAVLELRDFRQATFSTMNAMREDIADLGERLRSGFDRVDRKFEEIGGRQAQIAAMLQTLIDLDH